MYKCSVCLLLGDDRFHDIDQFDTYAELEVEEVQEVLGLPDGITLTEATFEQVKTFSLLADDDQAMLIAYHEATGSFDWQEASDAFVGRYANGAEFAESLCKEIGYIPKDLPDWVARHIDWQGVWDAELHWDYTEQGSYYFLTV